MATVYEAVDKYHADITDPGRGKHLWIVMAMFKVYDPEQSMNTELLLDSEHLVTLEGPGCFKCEQVYSPRIAQRFCQGVLTNATTKKKK